LQIDHREKTTSSSADTLSIWIEQLVFTDIKLNSPNGFAWASHSIRIGATTDAYTIGVNMEKIKFSGGWATESGVVLDYIDPVVVPTTPDWYFFGSLTPWGGQPRATRHTAT
jgi:hypothetical protein